MNSWLPSPDASLGYNVATFCVAAVGVWLSGSKLSAYVDTFAERTGIGKAFAGALLLGGATSLPELATTLTAAWHGAVEMAGNNLIGGISMQIMVLAAMDLIALRGRALTFFSPNINVLLQGVMLIVLLALTIAAVTCGEPFVFWGVGVWSIALFLAYLLVLYVLFRYEGNARWEPAGELAQPLESAKDMKDAHEQRYASTSTPKIAAFFALSALGVLVFGSLVALSGEGLAEQTGLGQGFVGAVLVALATSLPELSTTWSAIRFGAYSMAIANIVGTNCIEVALILPADLAYRDGAIIDALAPSVSFLAALGIVTTCIYLWGVLERRDRTILGMGVDSALVLVVYVGGIIIYWGLS